jgi:hypothetical protein
MSDDGEETSVAPLARDEACAVAMLDHHRIAHVIDVDVIGGPHVLAMELVHGAHFASCCRARRAHRRICSLTDRDPHSVATSPRDRRDHVTEGTASRRRARCRSCSDRRSSSSEQDENEAGTHAAHPGGRSRDPSKFPIALGGK